MLTLEELDEKERGDNLIRTPFPLGANRTAFLILPRDLKRDEVERINKFIETLPIPDSPQ